MAVLYLSIIGISKNQNCHIIMFLLGFFHRKKKEMKIHGSLKRQSTCLKSTKMMKMRIQRPTSLMLTVLNYR